MRLQKGEHAAVLDGPGEGEEACAASYTRRLDTD